VFRFFRKGDTQYAVLISIIVVSVIVGVFVFLAQDIEETSQRSVRDDLCKATVAIKAKTGGLASGQLPGSESPFEEDCPMEIVESKSITKAAQKAELASEMYRCGSRYWFGEEDMDMYSNWGFGSGPVHCEPCAKYKFNPEAEPLTYGEFGSYLSTTKLPGKEKTYAEILTGEDHATIKFGNSNVPPDTVMDINTPLYFVFRVEKHNEDNQELLSLFGADVDSVNEGGIPYETALAGAALGGLQKQGTMLIIKETADGFVAKNAAGVTQSFNGVTLFTTGDALAGAATKTGWVRKTATQVAKFVGKGATKFASGVAYGVVRSVAGKKAGTAAAKWAVGAVPVLGQVAVISMAVYDLGGSILYAGEVYPSIAIYSAEDITEVCGA